MTAFGSLREKLFRKETVLPLSVFVGFIIVWELAVPFYNVPQFILPQPSDILTAFVGNLDLFLPELQITLTEFAVAYSATIIFGYLVALLMSYWKTFETTFYPYVIVYRSVPVITLLPLFIIWFGFGFTSIVIISFLISFFPMVVNTLTGFKSVDDEMVEMVRSFSASDLQVYREVYFHASLPSVFAGLKITIVLAYTGVIVGEFLVANEGLGAMILALNTQFRTDLMFAGILMIAISELILFGLLLLVEQIVVDWN